jgi:Cys-tRNA(Pro)/Cys-tRNA(Cys) deacylase
MAKKSAGTPAITELTREAVTYTLHRYEHKPEVTNFGAEVVSALGVPAEQVFKTLVADLGDQLVVAVVPVSAQLDLKALAAAAGAKKAILATADDAERSSGYVVGGISPVGQRTRLRTFLDASALEHASIFVSAGKRGLQAELAPADLARVTEAMVGAFAS